MNIETNIEQDEHRRLHPTWCGTLCWWIELVSNSDLHESCASRTLKLRIIQDVVGSRSRDSWPRDRQIKQYGKDRIPPRQAPLAYRKDPNPSTAFRRTCKRTFQQRDANDAHRRTRRIGSQGCQRL